VVKERSLYERVVRSHKDALRQDALRQRGCLVPGRVPCLTTAHEHNAIEFEDIATAQTSDTTFPANAIMTSTSAVKPLAMLDTNVLVDALYECVSSTSTGYFAGVVRALTPHPCSIMRVRLGFWKGLH
jgi:hypothetical protein